MYQTALVRTEFGNGYPAEEPFARALDEAARSGQPMLIATYYPPVACRQAQDEVPANPSPDDIGQAG